MTGIRALKPTLTRAGMRAIFNASDDGLQARITHVALGDRRYAPDGNETSLQNEKVRVPVLGGKYLSDFIIEMVALLDHNQGFEVAELGVILDDGTLLAIWSDPQTPLAAFTPGVPIAISYVLGISALPDSTLEIPGDVNLNLFFGTEFAGIGTAIQNLALHIAKLNLKIDKLETREIALTERVNRITTLENLATFNRTRLGNHEDRIELLEQA